MYSILWNIYTKVSTYRSGKVSYLLYENMNSKKTVKSYEYMLKFLKQTGITLKPTEKLKQNPLNFSNNPKEDRKGGKTKGIKNRVNKQKQTSK